MQTKMYPHRIVALIITSALMSSVAQAATPYETRYRAMHAACLDRHWDDEKPSIHSPVTAFHDYRITGTERLVGEATMNLFRQPVKFFRQAQKATTGKTTPAERRLNSLIAELQNFANAKKMSPWQRACLTKCVSAHMIDTVGPSSSEFLIQPSRILEVGEGVCKQYSMLGEYVGRALGVPTKLVSDGFLEKEGHVFLKVKLDGRHYYSEPQNDRCEFFNLQ